MDLSNKQIKVIMTGVSHNPVRTVADVDVMTVVNNNVRQKFGSYELTFEETYQGPDDPALLAAITEQLEAI